MKTTRIFFALMLSGLSSLAFLTGCEKDADMNGNGSFAVKMTDAPADYAAMNVEIKEVSVYSASSGWVNLSNETKSYNVLSLTNGIDATLSSGSSGEVAAGTYTKVRLVFGDNNTLGVMSGDLLGGLLTFDLTYDGDKSVEIAIDKEIQSGSSAEVLLDFDAAASVTESGDLIKTYVLKPVIKEIKDATTGVKGQVQGAASAVIYLQGEAGGAAGSFTAYVNAQGQFLIRGVKEGTYTLTAIPSKTPDPNIPDPQPITIENVIITKGEIHNAGVISF